MMTVITRTVYAKARSPSGTPQCASALTQPAVEAGGSAGSC
jgi:hypothetical protein